LQQAGYNAVSLPNAIHNLPPHMRDALMNAKHIVIAGDCDGAIGSEVTEKLWHELPNCFRLIWPEGLKDANAVFLHENADIPRFRELVDGLTIQAYSQPMPFVTSLEEAMVGSNQTNLKDRPDRFHWPWPAVDEMAIILPGSVVALMATDTAMGKTSMVHQAALYGAMKWNEVVLNYQAELSVEEMVTLTTSHLLRKHRLHLSKEDHARAAGMMRGV